jgi:hypothetical protein
VVIRLSASPIDQGVGTFVEFFINLVAVNGHHRRFSSLLQVSLFGRVIVNFVPRPGALSTSN